MASFWTGRGCYVCRGGHDETRDGSKSLRTKRMSANKGITNKHEHLIQSDRWFFARITSSLRCHYQKLLHMTDIITNTHGYIHQQTRKWRDSYFILCWFESNTHGHYDTAPMESVLALATCFVSPWCCYRHDYPSSPALGASHLEEDQVLSITNKHEHLIQSDRWFFARIDDSLMLHPMNL